MALQSRIVHKMTPAGRVLRRPQHPFQLRTRPWQLQPMLIAPVLPGETMKNLLLQARTITDPVKNRFIGWWNEYYFFYVKHRDLAARDEFVSMVLDPDWSNANVDATANVEKHYFNKGVSSHVNWVDHCLKEVTDWYFRNEGEAWDVVTSDGLPHAQVGGNTWLDSAVNEADYILPDIAVDGADGSTPDSAITVGEVTAAMQQYEFLRNNFAIDMTYEEFLQSYGVRQARTEIHKPELLRFVRNWAYPVSAIDPTDGSAASAVTWSVTERADKDRFFSEPGFIFGLQCTRPKVYLSGQKGTATALLEDAYSWLPAVLTNDPRTSLKLVPDNDILGNVTDANGVWVDIRDLFLYGEQFVNFAVTETDAGMVALPTAGLQKRYATSTDADALFAAASPANLIRSDGLVSLAISGSQVDQSA